MLSAGILALSGVSCATASASTSPSKAEALISVAFVKERNYIGMSADEVIRLLGRPTMMGSCHIRLPVAGSVDENIKMVLGSSAKYEETGQDETHLIRIRLQFCAVNRTVISQQFTIKDTVFIEGEMIYSSGYTDFILLRKILNEEPKKDGEDEEYILQPGELEA